MENTSSSNSRKQNLLKQRDGGSLRWGKLMILGCVLIAATFFVFRNILSLPYVGDDWAVIHKMVFQTPKQILMLAVDTSLLQIRPLQYLYTWAILVSFGSYSSAFHIPALAFHICSSIAVVWLMKLLLKSSTMAWIIGFLYAIAANVHLSPQMWLVGSSDVLGPLLIFGSFILLIKGRRGLSAIAFLASLMFKEFALAMLVVMTLYLACEKWSNSKPLEVARWTLGRIWIHLLVALPFLVYKLMFMPSPMQFAPDHPYKMALTGPHIITNGIKYTIWLFQTILPFEISRPRRLIRGLASGSTQDIFGVAVIVALIVIATVLGMKRGRNPVFYKRQFSHWIPGFLVAWAVLGMGPVYFLPNHAYPYYMTYSLPALLAMIVLLARWLAERMRVEKRHLIVLVIAFATSQFIWSSLYIQLRLSSGEAILQGAHQVAAVHGYLVRKHPHIGKGTTFILAADSVADTNKLMWALRDDKALQTWYSDRSIKVFEKRYVRIIEDKLIAVKPPESTLFPGSEIEGSGAKIDPDKVICIKVSNQNLVRQYALN